MSDDSKTKQKLAELIELMNKNDLAELEVEEEGNRIRLRKMETQQTVYVQGPAAHPAVNAPAGEPQAGAQAQAATDNLITIKSPMVGTLYRAPSPDSDPFVEKGDPISEESVVCIIEAMKVMNEIKAECKGVIKDILVGNGEAVEYGQPLFLVEPA